MGGLRNAKSFLHEGGAPGMIRTCDPLIRSRLSKRISDALANKCQVIFQEDVPRFAGHSWAYLALGELHQVLVYGEEDLCSPFDYPL